MGAETVVTLLAVAVIVGAIALYLIMITATLVNVSSTLTTILGQVNAVVDASRPLASVVPDIQRSVQGAEDALRAVSQAAVGRPRSRARAR